MEQQQTDSKTHYTNLEPATPQNFYITSEGGAYQSTGSGYTYIPPSSNKDYPVYHTESPILYKGDPTLTSAISNRPYGSMQHHTIYGNSNGTIPSGSPSGQPVYPYCKQEHATFWQPEYNVNTVSIKNNNIILLLHY